MREINILYYIHAVSYTHLCEIMEEHFVTRMNIRRQTTRLQCNVQVGEEFTLSVGEAVVNHLKNYKHPVRLSAFSSPTPAPPTKRCSFHLTLSTSVITHTALINTFDSRPDLCDDDDLICYLPKFSLPRCSLHCFSPPVMFLELLKV